MLRRGGRRDAAVLCVAVSCDMLYWVVACCSVIFSVMQCHIQCDAVSYSVWCSVIFSVMHCHIQRVVEGLLLLYVLPWVAACCGMLQCVAVRCSVILSVRPRGYCCGGTTAGCSTKLQCVAVRCIMLQCQIQLWYSVRCSVIFGVWRWATYVNRSDMDCNTLQHIAARCNTLQHSATHFNTLQLITKTDDGLKYTNYVNVPVHCKMLQSVAVCCSVL